MRYLSDKNEGNVTMPHADALRVAEVTLVKGKHKQPIAGLHTQMVLQRFGSKIGHISFFLQAKL